MAKIMHCSHTVAPVFKKYEPMLNIVMSLPVCEDLGTLVNAMHEAIQPYQTNKSFYFRKLILVHFSTKEKKSNILSLNKYQNHP